jgi:hypothetical protein
MSKMPSSEYALSSWRKVLRLAAYDNRSVMLKSDKGLPRRVLAGMPVTLQMYYSREALLPNNPPSSEKKSTDTGVISSCRVQPRENYALFRNIGSQSSLDLLAESVRGRKISGR